MYHNSTISYFEGDKAIIDCRIADNPMEHDYPVVAIDHLTLYPSWEILAQLHAAIGDLLAKRPGESICQHENALMDAYPDVSLCVSHERWRHAYNCDGPDKAFKSHFEISIIPKDPGKVESFYGATMGEAVQKALDAAPKAASVSVDPDVALAEEYAKSAEIDDRPF